MVPERRPRRQVKLISRLVRNRSTNLTVSENYACSSASHTHWIEAAGADTYRPLWIPKRLTKWGQCLRIQISAASRSRSLLVTGLPVEEQPVDDIFDRWKSVHSLPEYVTEGFCNYEQSLRIEPVKNLHCTQIATPTSCPALLCTTNSRTQVVHAVQILRCQSLCMSYTLGLVVCTPTP